MFIQQPDRIAPQPLGTNSWAPHVILHKPRMLQHDMVDGHLRRVRIVTPKEDALLAAAADKVQQAVELRGRRAQRNVVVEAADVGAGLQHADGEARGQVRHHQRAEGARADKRQGAAGVRQDKVDVRAGAHGAGDDEVDGGAGGGQGIVEDGLREARGAAADELGRDVEEGRVDEDEGFVGLQLGEEGREGWVAEELAAVGAEEGDAAAELLLCEEVVELGEGAFEIGEVGDHAEEAKVVVVLL